MNAQECFRIFRIALTVVVAMGFSTACADADDVRDTRPILDIVFPGDVEARLALLGAPEHLRGGATVYVYGEKGFTKYRDGMNGFTCLLNRDGFLYGGKAFKPTCWDAEGRTSYVPVMLRAGELLAAGNSADEVRADIDAGFRDGRFHRPTKTGIAYMLVGDVDIDSDTGEITRTAFPGHYMIYAPGVTSADLGYSPDASRIDRSLPFIFDAGAGGSDLAYLITVPHH
jgi:hypothetical protein